MFFFAVVFLLPAFLTLVFLTGAAFFVDSFTTEDAFAGSSDAFSPAAIAFCVAGLGFLAAVFFFAGFAFGEASFFSATLSSFFCPTDVLIGIMWVICMADRASPSCYGLINN